MKKVMFALVFLFILCCEGYSQNFKLNVYGNYVFDDRIDSYFSSTDFYRGKIKGGLLWGAGIEYEFDRHYGFELLYMRQDTKSPMNYFDGGIRHTEFDMGINHIMLAGQKTFSLHNSIIEPYAGAMLGFSIINIKNPDNGNSRNETKFSWGVRGGANFWVSQKVGIKLNAQLISVPQAAGGGFYFGTGGSGVFVSTVSTINQFGIGGGLIFKLGSSGAKR